MKKTSFTSTNSVKMDEREEEIVPSTTSEDDDDDTLDIGENKVEPPKKRKRRKVGELSGCQMALKRLEREKGVWKYFQQQNRI